jgi:2-dehydro-3-deoxyphosphogluconate aldolase/(4S)-4-hydroxy-2-oxoglutarate aldolase
VDPESLARRNAVDTVSSPDRGVFDRIRDGRVLPVVTLDRAEDAVPVGRALLAGGLACIEITFRTDAASHAIASLSNRLPEMLVGAGTVLTVEQAQVAFDAGSRFVVSPGYDDDVVEWCLRRGIPVLPGVMTPTEITRALRHGLDLVKFFPAEAAGGAAAVAALGATFPAVRFVPTGGIDPENLERYLRLPMVAACGGSWITDRRLIAERDFDRIRRLTEEAVAVVAHVRDRASRPNP